MLRVLRPGGLLVLDLPKQRVAMVHRRRQRSPPASYQGLEHWPGWWTLDRWVQAHGGTVARHVGIHGFPFVLTLTTHCCDGSIASAPYSGPCYVNQGVLPR